MKIYASIDTDHRDTARFVTDTLKGQYTFQFNEGDNSYTYKFMSVTCDDGTAFNPDGYDKSKYKAHFELIDYDIESNGNIEIISDRLYYTGMFAHWNTVCDPSVNLDWVIDRLEERNYDSKYGHSRAYEKKRKDVIDSVKYYELDNVAHDLDVNLENVSDFDYQLEIFSNALNDAGGEILNDVYVGKDASEIFKKSYKLEIEFEADSDENPTFDFKYNKDADIEKIKQAAYDLADKFYQIYDGE